MVAPVHFKPPDENDLATPAREITSRHRVDRRSLLPPRRVMPQRGMPPAASAETPVAALGADRGCARQRAAVLDHGAAPAVGFVVRHIADRMRNQGKRGKTSPFCRWAGCLPEEPYQLYRALRRALGSNRPRLSVPAHRRRTTSLAGTREAKFSEPLVRRADNHVR